MIPVKCTTNLDDYDCYITRVACTPDIGDKVKVLYKGINRALSIVQITHAEIINGRPHLILELA